MSEVLIATVAIDISEVTDEAMKELADLDETLAEVIRYFNAEELMTECVKKFLTDLRDSGKYTIEAGFLMTESKHLQEFDSAGNKILGVVKSEKLAVGIGFAVSGKGRVGFIDYRADIMAPRNAPKNDSAEAFRFKSEAKDLLLTEALAAIFRATGFNISEFHLERDQSNGALLSVNMTGVK
ncbi:hypothetical protein HZB94_04445 [Candidatus Falkowbacteria bacterium]|nr:hypothetical protein [Candidatus Falkowbacteria bacterium]